MDTPHQPPAPSAEDAAFARGVRWRAVLLLILTAVLLAGTGVYLLWARGAFEPTQRLYLITDDSDGVSVGMNLTFSGFPIGRVRRIRLWKDGSVRLRVDVDTKDAHWLRTTSVFTLERGIVGAARLRAFTGEPDSPPLPPRAVRNILRGDVSAEIPRMVADVRGVLQNLQQMTGAGSDLNATLAQVHALTARANGPGGAVAALTGDPADAKRLSATLAAMGPLVQRLDGLTAHADAQVFGRKGLAANARETTAQLQQALQQVRGLLTQATTTLNNLNAISADVRAATPGLADTRAQIDADLARVDAMLAQLSGKWPFAAGEHEVKLP